MEENNLDLWLYYTVHRTIVYSDPSGRSSADAPVMESEEKDEVQVCTGSE